MVNELTNKSKTQTWNWVEIATSNNGEYPPIQ